MEYLDLGGSKHDLDVATIECSRMTPIWSASSSTVGGVLRFHRAELGLGKLCSAKDGRKES
uniref:Uncharacterized protein n=1 Tax=Arundo donax TaxID=35708 RepID=A0A0A9C3K3_ARUDO